MKNLQSFLLTPDMCPILKVSRRVKLSLSLTNGNVAAVFKGPSS